MKLKHKCPWGAKRYQEEVTGPKKNITPKQGEKWEEIVKLELRWDRGRRRGLVAIGTALSRSSQGGHTTTYSSTISNVSMTLHGQSLGISLQLCLWCCWVLSPSVHSLVTLSGQCLSTSLHLCFLHYWVLSPSVQPHDLTWSISRYISATVFLTLLSAVSQCTASAFAWS
jgi:hypothetical protein